MSAPALSIIIVTHNSATSLPTALEWIPAACGKWTHEIVIVDNGSTDGTASQPSVSPNLVLVRLESNRGFAFASNRGAECAKGEYLLFLNPDVSLDSNSVATLVGFLSENSKTGAIVPRLRNADGTFQPSCRQFPTPFNILFSRGSFFGKHFSEIAYTLPDSSATLEVPAVAGAALLIRKSIFDEIGGFDERFFLYMEDTDLCLRLFQQGYRNWYLPEAGAVHGWGKGSSSGRLFRLWHHHLSTWKYFLKHIPNGFTILLLPFLLAVNFALRAITIPFSSRATR